MSAHFLCWTQSWTQPTLSGNEVGAPFSCQPPDPYMECTLLEFGRAGWSISLCILPPEGGSLTLSPGLADDSLKSHWWLLSSAPDLWAWGIQHRAKVPTGQQEQSRLTDQSPWVVRALSPGQRLAWRPNFLTFWTTRPPGNRMFNGFYLVLLAPGDTRNCPTCHDSSGCGLSCLLWLWGHPLLCPGADWPLFPFHPKQLDRWLRGKSSHPEACCTPVTDAFSRGRLLLLVLRTWRLLFKAQENRQEACSCCLPLLLTQRRRWSLGGQDFPGHRLEKLL